MQYVDSFTSNSKHLVYTCFEFVSDTNEYLSSRFPTIVKRAVVLTSLYALNKSCSNVMMAGLALGIAFPEFTVRLTDDIWNKLFHPKEPDVSYGNAGLKKDNHKIFWIVGRLIDVIEPVIITGYIGFFALPVVTIQLITLLASARFGAKGMRSDLF